MNEQHCDQCASQCAVDALRCNRGRVHFGQEPVERSIPDGPVGLLQECGFILHHGDLDPNEVLAALNSQEQAELERLLSALLADWRTRMPEALPKRRHGHP